MATTNVTISNVENLHLGAGIDEAALEERLRGANIDEIGYGPVPDETTVEAAVAESQERASDEAEEARHQRLADRYDEEYVDARARRNFLRNVVSHADKSRGLEGFQTNHYNRPLNPGANDKKQNSETLKAHESLLEACGRCALKDKCVLVNDIDGWLDVHPYKSKRRDGDRKPGSLLPPGITESRETFLRELKEDPMAHCDPRKRPQVKKAA